MERVRPDDWQRIAEFFDNFDASGQHPGFYVSYQTPDQFERLVREHLSSYLFEISGKAVRRRGRIPQPKPAPEVSHGASPAEIVSQPAETDPTEKRRPLDILTKKRDGFALTRGEIDSFIQAFVQGEVPDYQAAAWAMAVYLRGMNEAETTALTLAMAHSGQVLDLSNVAPRVLDKHSTGGVGDKTTLVVGPLIAALDLPFGKMSGRGLGFSGGTLDKLEAIPGFRSDLSTDEFIAQLKRIGIVVSGQTHALAPADGKLYALRDVTGTVSSLPLIASSIMSKKIAAGAHIIVLDVKVGRGAFMKNEADATALAELMVKIGAGVGRKVGAVLSDMNQPLGRAVGNALEVVEAIETLKGRGPADFVEHCLAVAEQLLLVSGVAKDETEARAKLQGALSGGRALEKFGDWIEAQGGTRRVVDDYSVVPQAKIVQEIAAPRDGYIAGIDAQEVGLTVVDLGGGRFRKGDVIDHAVGVVFQYKVGDRVTVGEPLFTIYADDRMRFEVAKARLLAAYTFADSEPVALPLIHKIIK
ncbi:MAG: thymidine phosphorylase [Chloroflexi bacterium]|nr:thymidine phosphorylase [Chloroflexota bacterium]